MLVILCVLFLFHLCPSFATQPVARPGYHHTHCDYNNSNYTSNSTYHQNLILLFGDIISSNSKITNGFYNNSIGEIPDIVYGIGYCPGDVLLDECRSCFKNATTNFFKSCPIQKKVVGYYDKCVLRYSNRPIYGVMKLQPTYKIKSRFHVNQSGFNNVLSSLLGSLVMKTVAGNSTLKFAMNKANVSTSQTIYAFTQCSPDLSKSDCYNCLSHSISDLSVCCHSFQVVRFFRPSCNLRFGVFRFSDAFITPSSLSPMSSPPTPGNGRKTAMIVAVVVAITVVCLLVVVVVYILLRRGRRKSESADDELEEEDGITRHESLQIAYGQVTDTTHGFSQPKVERGEFGTGFN